MKSKFLAVLFLLLAMAGTVSAAGWTCQGSIVINDPVIVTSTYSSAAIHFTWTHDHNLGATSDFNDMIYWTTSSNPDLVLSDVNTMANSGEVSLRAAPGETVTMHIRAVDGNADGYFCSNDVTRTFTTGSNIQAASYMFYYLLYGLGSLVMLIIVAILGILILKKFDIDLFRRIKQ